MQNVTTESQKNQNGTKPFGNQDDGKNKISVIQRIARRLLPRASKQKVKQEKVSISTLFRYATCWDMCLIGGAAFFAGLTGLGHPVGTILYGEFTSLMIDRSVMTGKSHPTVLLQLFGGGKVLNNASYEENKQALLDDSVAFGISCAIMSVCQFVFGIFCVDLMNYSAMRQISRIRKKLLESVMRQDMTWYDTNTHTNFASSITEDLEKLSNGIGEKVGIFMYLIFSFSWSVIIAFSYGWKLTLVVLSCAPVISLSVGIVAKIQSTLIEKELDAYSYAGTCAEEVLASIRTVVAFGGEQKEIDRYSDRLAPATKLNIKKGMLSGIGSGIMWFLIFSTYAIAFWYGVNLVMDDRDKEEPEYTAAVLMIVFFGVMAGAENIGLTIPHIEAFATARGSANKVYGVIDQVSHIDPLAERGIRLEEFQGHIEFKDVHFRYPNRPEVPILQGVNLTIHPGERVAFVGTSGCGKSTLIQLIQRLYDPISGSVLIDGNNARQLNVSWLRSYMGVVGQEPVLFQDTILENILHGWPQATREEAEEAAKEANCHDFIKKLPDGYETVIGERGSQLSGGQKQRIAIARALVRKPKLLLLDEATSALDLTSEAKVQKALDKASFKCTTLIVSHRLSTIRDVDRIIVLKNGVVVESGNHDELIKLQGNYWQLVEADASATSEPQKSKKKVMDLKSVSMAKSEVVDLETSSGSSSTTISSESSIDSELDGKERKGSFFRILKLNGKEWPYLLVGCLSAIVVGASFPAFAIVFGEIFEVLGNQDKMLISQKSIENALWFVLVGVCTAIGAFLQTYMFNISGAHLTTRVRIYSFGTMLKQEMAWFDRTKNSVGNLCARLSGDAAAVHGATGTWVGAVVQAMSTFLIGVLLSLYFSWNLTLVSLCSCPVVLIGIVLEARVFDEIGMKNKLAIERSTRIGVEAMSNIRTVASLGREKYFIDKYSEELDKANKEIRRSSRYRGVVFSLGQASPFFGYALSLYYGGTLVANREIDYSTVIKVSESLIFGSWMVGQALAFAPNLNAARLSAGRIFRLLDRVPEIISPVVPDEDKTWKCEGLIKYSKLWFSYPTRPDQDVLRSLDLVVPRGMKVALVGSSGCGKSTCIQLLQRLYDPDYGTITLDGRNISKDISLPLLRSQLGIVQQEPVLFDRTIAENIAYGDNSRVVTQQEILQAAVAANIHGFITQLPLGYETRIGSRGTQLSGGQKQRIAIARALVRDPRVLLLDEATSALDTQSEQIVQAALDTACEGRTCIIIAHRLSTIRNADVIYVIDSGKVVERGNHDELMAQGGFYSRLYTTNE